MTAIPLERRVAALEEEMARLKAQIGIPGRTAPDWLDRVWGTFANDPVYEEAMRLGREWRESFRPKPRKQRRKKQPG